MIIPAVLLAAFLVLGIVFSQGKGAGIVTAFSGKTGRQDEGYDEKRQTKLMGAAMLSCAGCMLIALIGKLISAGWLYTGGFCLLIPCALVFGIIDYMNTK